MKMATGSSFCSDFLNAGKDLVALRKKQQCEKEEATTLDMDLLLGSPVKRSKSNKKKGKAKAALKPKKPKFDDECEVVNETVPALDPSSDEDEKILAAALLEQAKQEQRNINRHYRELSLEQAEQPFQLDVELTNYLAAHNSSSCSYTEAEEAKVEVDDTDIPITIYVRWKFACTKEKYTIKKYQTFESIFRIYADKENVPIEKVHMEIVGDDEECKLIKPWFTPDDVNMSGIALLEGCLMNIESKKNESEDEDDFIDDDKIELKMQLKGRRDRLTVRMGPQETFKLAMLKLADQISQPVEKLRFHFDGEVVLNTQTPEDLDLEGGEVFDVEIL
ncbi:hypothetical protein B566_EDAN010803 [Ephemera danica]|nr:hypothetical protein B566_EDAN010803 [Ephemera danica]